MTYEQYWYGDPWIAKAYREAHLLKRKMHNEDMWLQGMYNYNGFGAVIATAFGKRKQEYPRKPFDVFPKTEIEKREEAREKKRKLINFLSAFKKKSDEKANKGK